MRRITLVLGLAVTMAVMMVLTVGSALAKDSQQKQTYVQEVGAKQYFALPGSAAWFRGEVEGDGDLGLTGELDTKISYSGTPGPGVTTDITGGSWVLCSNVTPDPPNPQTQPVCKVPEEPGSAIALQGNVRDGTAAWDTDDGTASVPTGLLPPSGPPCIPVYGGAAKVEAVFTVRPGGTVNGVPVTEKGIGHFKGTLDHSPLLDYKCPGDGPGLYHATLTGTLELKF